MINLRIKNRKIIRTIWTLKSLYEEYLFSSTNTIQKSSTHLQNNTNTNTNTNTNSNTTTTTTTNNNNNNSNNNNNNNNNININNSVNKNNSENNLNNNINNGGNNDNNENNRNYGNNNNNFISSDNIPKEKKNFIKLKIPKNQRDKKINQNLHPSYCISSQPQRKFVSKYEISNFERISTMEGKHVHTFLVELPSYSRFNLYLNGDHPHYLFVDEITKTSEQHSNNNNKNNNNNNNNNNMNKLNKFLIMVDKGMNWKTCGCSFTFDDFGLKYVFASKSIDEKDLTEYEVKTDSVTLSISFDLPLKNEFKEIKRFQLNPIYLCELQSIIEWINIDLQNISSPQFSECLLFSCIFRDTILSSLLDRMQINNNNNNNNNNSGVDNYQLTITELQDIRNFNSIIPHNNSTNNNFEFTVYLETLKILVNKPMVRLKNILPQNIDNTINVDNNLFINLHLP